MLKEAVTTQLPLLCKGCKLQVCKMDSDVNEICQFPYNKTVDASNENRSFNASSTDRELISLEGSFSLL